MAKQAKPKKIARHSQEPLVRKEPKHKDPVIEGSPLAWRFSGCDCDGPFAWSAIESADKFKEVIWKLHEFEGKTWYQIAQAGSHPIAKDRLEKPARDRLRKIQRDDVDELMSFRLTGPNRVWCIQTGNIMRVLWWDPDHRVYIVPRDPADRTKRKRR